MEVFEFISDAKCVSFFFSRTENANWRLNYIGMLQHLDF